MSNPLVVVARLEVKAGHVEFVKEQAEQLIELTRIEPGCLEYVLHQDNDNPHLFMFIERWETKFYLDAHLASIHMQAFSAAIEDVCVSLSINQLSVIA
ncbi:antibiotic biosynthesis monooxygenase [Vibrio sp. AK197]